MTAPVNISVLVPVYNVEPYLAQCLESICSQTLRELEIVCVDDASTDGSLSILREFAERVEAADFVRMIEKRQGIKISAPEEIAFKYGWIDRDTLLESAERYGKSPYGQHLKNVADGKLKY